MPCYNPDPDWHLTVEDKFRRLQDHYGNLQLELTIINDGSTVNLKESFSYLKQVFPFITIYELEKNKGKGFSIRYAVQHQTADYYVFTDVDFPYQISSMYDLIDKLTERHSDIAIGIRDRQYYREIPFVRRVISGLLKNANQVFFRLRTNDTQCGLKGFNKKGRNIFLQTRLDGYLFDLEFVRLASRADHLTISLCRVKLREGVTLSSIHASSLFGEAGDYLRLLFS